MVNQNDTNLLYDWPYAEQLIFRTLSPELIESHGRAHLWRALNSGRAIAVVGSGATMAYGRPAWSGILENMRAWIVNQYENDSDKRKYKNHYEFQAAWKTFQAYGLEKPVEPGLWDYTTVFQVMENLFVAMETITAEDEAARNGRTPDPGIRADSKQRFRTHFRHHFRGHVKRCHGMIERLAGVMYPEETTLKNAIGSFRKDVLAIYRSRMTRIEQANCSSDEREAQEKIERSIRNLLAPRWMFDDTLDKDAIDDEASETSLEHGEDFLFGVKLATILKDEVIGRVKNVSKAGTTTKLEKAFLEKLQERLNNVKLDDYLGNNSSAIPQEGLWFLSEILVSLVGATSPKTGSLPRELHAQSTERWADPTRIYEEADSLAKDHDTNPLFHTLQKCAYEIAKQDGNSSAPSVQRTILARDPLTVLFRELDITRFMTTNYDLEIESMFEHHGFQLQTLERGEGNDADDISRQVYTNVTGERATSLDFRSENAASMIDFSLDERADISHVVHLHGSARPGVELAVTEDDYKSFHVTEHSRRDAGRSAMDLAFTSNPLVFVGLGMDEPDILRPLRAFSTETGDLSERPAIAILARTGRMADSLFDKPTPELEKSVENATAKRSADLLAKWGVMPVFYGASLKKENGTQGTEDKFALAKILFHLSRISRDKNLTRLARAASEESDDEILTLFNSPEMQKFAADLKEHGASRPLRSAFRRFNANWVSEIERQPFNKVKFDFEFLLSGWPEPQFFRYLVEKIDGATSDPKAARNVCHFVRAYRDLCLGLEQSVQTMFLTAFLNRCAVERAEWLTRWTKVPRARRTIVNEPRSWTRSKT